MAKLQTPDRGVPIPFQRLSLPDLGSRPYQHIWLGPGRNFVEMHRDDPQVLKDYYVEDRVFGHYRKDREHLLLQNAPRADEAAQQRILAWLRDHVNQDIPRHWYQLVLGHDLHLSTFATLHFQHYHAHFRDPFTGEMGWWENVGLAGTQKVTIAFRDFIVDQLQTDTTAMGDYKYHEVGLSATAEANTDTALLSTTGIARVAGTQTEVAADQYRSVATVTADTAETWQEHGIFNAATSVTLMDRSVLSPTAPVNPSDTVQFTYTLTENAEA
jgi:hypothetical protein